MSRRNNLNLNEHVVNRKVSLIKAGHNYTSLSKKTGVTKQCICQAILGNNPSLRICRKIAKILGVSVVDFWPDVFGDVTEVFSENNEQKAM
jgi:lambda repressor-like predicted transcriptional regulator